MTARDVGLEVKSEPLGQFALDLGFSSKKDESEIADSNVALSLPFEKQRRENDVGADVSSASEIARLTSLLRAGADHDVSAEVAARERVSRPEAGLYIPGNKPRNTRSLMTIATSVAAVLALASVGVLVAIKSQDSTPEQRAYDTYVSRQLAVSQSDRALTETFERLESAKSDADSTNVTAAAALTAVVGVSDESSRAATETMRLAFEASLAEITASDPADTLYVATEVTAESTLTEIAAGVDDLAVEASRIEDAQLQLDSVFQSLNEARSAFASSFANFAATIPASATALMGENSDAGQEWRDAVANSVNALDVAAGANLGANEMLAYAAAAIALKNENARVVEEKARSEEDTPEGDSDGLSPDRQRTAPRSPSSPAPVVPPVAEPGPQPDPVTPEPEPVPEPWTPVEPA